MISAGLVDKAEILKKSVGGMQGNPMLGIESVQLRKVEKTEEKTVEEKKSVFGATITNPIDNQNQNLAHLSNLMVQGAIRKSQYFFCFNFFR